MGLVGCGRAWKGGRYIFRSLDQGTKQIGEVNKKAICPPLLTRVDSAVSHKKWAASSFSLSGSLHSFRNLPHCCPTQAYWTRIRLFQLAHFELGGGSMRRRRRSQSGGLRMVRKHVRVRRGRRWARHTVASLLPWNERTDGCSNREGERASSWLLVARRRHGGVQAFSERDSDMTAAAVGMTKGGIHTHARMAYRVAIEYKNGL